MVKPGQPPRTRAARTTMLRELGRVVREAGIELGTNDAQPAPTPTSRAVDPIPAPSSETDADAFSAAMRGVLPASWRHAPLPSEPPEPRPALGGAEAPYSSPLPPSDDPDDFRLLVEAASSDENLRDHPEYIEGWVGIDGKRLLPGLRDGVYSIQDQLDLHGLSRPEARLEVEEFIRRMSRFRPCCVKIIHGRGINSRTERAVLKENLQRWLSTRRLSRHVVAYASAPAHDGGVGAVYVLLRHNGHNGRIILHRASPPAF